MTFPQVDRSVIGAGLFGLALGAAIVAVATLAFKWIAFLSAGVLAVFGFALLQDRSRALWAIFILSSQAYVSLYFMHAHAGSHGIEFPLFFLLGLLAAGWDTAVRLGQREEGESWSLQLGGPLAWPIGLLFAVWFASLSVTHERFVGLTTTLRLFELYALYLIGLNFVRTPERFRATLAWLAVVLLMQSAVYLVQAATGVTFSLTGEVFADRGVRAGGTVGSNSAVYATFVSPILLILATRWMARGAALRERLLLLVPLLFGAVTFVLTLRRGAWAGFLLAVVWLLYLGVRRDVFVRAIPRIGAAVIAIALLLSPWIAEQVDEVRSGNRLSEAYDERFQLMEIALEVIQQNPIVGVGPGAYRAQFREYVDISRLEGWVHVEVHNYYLLLAAETGIPGVLAFLWFLLAGFRMGLRGSWSAQRDVQLAAMGFSAAVVSHACAIFWEPMRDFTPNALFWLLAGTIAGGLRIAEAASAESARAERTEYDPAGEFDGVRA